MDLVTERCSHGVAGVVLDEVTSTHTACEAVTSKFLRPTSTGKGIVKEWTKKQNN